jgi:hypothetical protein
VSMSGPVPSFLTYQLTALAAGDATLTFHISFEGVTGCNPEIGPIYNFLRADSDPLLLHIASADAPTPTPTPTPTLTATPTATAPPGVALNGGCSARGGGGASFWLLLLPAIIALRRRRRLYALIAAAETDAVDSINRMVARVTATRLGRWILSSVSMASKR